MARKATALTKPDLDVLALPEDVTLLPDNSTHQHRFDFTSSSGRVYRVAQRKYNPKTGKGGWWACSCPSFIHGRKGSKDCKHLRDFGLPGNHERFEIGEISVGALDGEVGATTMRDSERAGRKSAQKTQLRAIAGGEGKVVDPSSGAADLSLLITDPNTYSLRDEIKKLGGRPRYQNSKFQGWLMPNAAAKAKVEALLAESSKAAAPKAESKALPAVKPTNVEMKNGQIVVTFDAKDQAAVFALLSKIS